MGRKDRLAEEIARLIEKNYSEFEKAALHSDTDSPVDAEYKLFNSLFSKELNPKEIKSNIIQEVVEELEKRNLPVFILNEKKNYDGIPISALLNLSPEKKIEIEIKKPWRDLGMYNRKNVTIKGKVGGCLGIGMSKGEIIVDGDAEDYVGICMKGGKIIVNGKVKDCAGCCMLGGEIWVNGDAGKDLGSFMEGGRIVVNGNAEEGIGDFMFGGEIWVKNLKIENLSSTYEIGIGNIYRGLPGKDFEPVRIFEILEKPREGYVFFYFDKREKGNFVDRATYVLTKVFEAYNDIKSSENGE